MRIISMCHTCLYTQANMPKIPPSLRRCNLRELSRSPWLNPYIVLRFHWLPWSWGHLSMNPAVPAWLVLELLEKPWDWRSLSVLPCAVCLRTKVLSRFPYGILRTHPLDEGRFTLPHRWKRYCGIRIANEIYLRVIIPRRRSRWLAIVSKILNRGTRFGCYDARVNRVVASFLAPRVM